MKKHALVTGGAGFVGSHLCEKLLELGFKVTSLDNYFTGKKENHIHGVTYIEGHTKDIESLVTEKVDIVYHLGEYSRVAESINEPNTVFDLNLTGTINVLEFCHKRKIKIVYAGSSTKFGRSHDGETEGSNLSPYTWAKAALTDLVVQHGNWYNLPYAIVYFYNVFGERELSGKYGTVIQIFKEKYLNNEVLPVRMPGTQSRIYTHVKDTVDALVLVGEKGEGDGFGISAHESYTILDVAKMFTGATIEMQPERKTSRIESAVNCEKIESLGWKQKYFLKDYIKDIVDLKINN
jgi:UDP-glucose 4-epimerase